MNLRSLSHLSNQELLRDLAAIVARDRGTTAEMLAHIAEVDDRRLYAQEGFPSMFAYCVQVLHMSEDTAFKRIRAARTARQFPAIFEAVADGRLHLTAVVFLAPHLTSENADELLAAATHKTKAEIEWLLAECEGSLQGLDGSLASCTFDRIFRSSAEGSFLLPRVISPACVVNIPCGVTRDT